MAAELSAVAARDRQRSLAPLLGSLYSSPRRQQPWIQLPIRGTVACGLGLMVAGDGALLPAQVGSPAPGLAIVAAPGPLLWPMFFVLCATVGLLVAGYHRRAGRSKVALEPERRRVEQVEKELRKLSRAIEQSPVVILITDTTGAIEYANPSFTTKTGYTFEEVKGKNPRLLRSGENAPETYRDLWQTITQGREWQGEFHNRKKNGELFWESATISPIADESGVITHFLAVKEDITERKRLELQVRHMQKMDAVGQLAGGIAHDFSNILAATMLHLNLLQREPHLSPHLGASLKELELEARRAAALTRQLLLFSRRQILRAERVDLNEVVGTMAKMLRRLIGENVRLTFQGPTQPLWIEADAGMIEQVVMNLCVNARDAMPGGGTLSLETKRLEASVTNLPAPEARPGTFVRLSVADTGCGMDGATIKRLFEPFFTTKEAGKGTGLGLATAYGIVRQHKGWITVESEPGHGSVFHVYLPESPAPLPPSSPNKEPVIVGGKEAILVVEDDEPMRRMITLTLESFGYAVLAAVSGKHALSVWTENGRHIDLLLSDMVMPDGLNGLNLAKRLRETRPHLPVVIMSGYNPEFAHPTVPESGEMAFLPKPFRADQLAGIVRNLLEHSRHVQ